MIDTFELYQVSEILTYENFVEYYNFILCGFGVFFVSVIYILFYHGVFHDVVVKAAKPPFTKNTFVAYKFTENYSESRYLLSEVQALAPQLDSFSIYHENFYKEMRGRVGSSVGVVLSEKMNKGVYEALLEAGYKLSTFPEIDFAVVSSFPYRNQYSLSVAVRRTYPKLKHYIKRYRLCAHPIMELYTRDQIHFVAPLSKQFDFYAEEALPDAIDDDDSSDDFEGEECVRETTACRVPLHHDKNFHQMALRVRKCVCDPVAHVASCERHKRAI